ncbi:hypothetical protein, partial [Miniimonas arenae]|uniref:hypothetical protein n=1 Tax=Miniimonas arenae TaxID=676201 RepID=UPI0028AC95EA
MVDGDVELECPTGAVAPGVEPDDRLRFSASALSGDLGARDPAAVEAALDALRASGATDVPLELQGVPAAEARWFVLRETDEGTLVAVGAWPPSEPA